MRLGAGVGLVVMAAALLSGCGSTPSAHGGSTSTAPATESTSAAATSCTVNSELVSSCAPWWGAAVDVAQAQLGTGVAAYEQRTGRRLDIVHTYHDWRSAFPSPTELAVAAGGRLLLLNWRATEFNGSPVQWSKIASGAEDATIDAEAARLKALPYDVMIAFSHEPELDIGKNGTAAQFAAAFRHVVNRVRADGVSNVKWVWDVIGLTKASSADNYAALWPGDSYVDWIAWDPYNWGGCKYSGFSDFAGTISPFYDWLTSHGHGNKPFMLAEYGTIEKPGDPGGKAAWFAGEASALTKFPLIHAAVYFDYPAPPGNCDWLSQSSTASANAFATLAKSGEFAPTASQDPRHAS